MWPGMRPPRGGSRRNLDALGLDHLGDSRSTCWPWRPPGRNGDDHDAARVGEQHRDVLGAARAHAAASSRSVAPLAVMFDPKALNSTLDRLRPMARSSSG